jgi:hypothetical protein
MHDKTFFFEFFFVVWYEFFSFERFGRMNKNKNIFLKKILQKPGIWIPNLYLYDVKIQINIKQNLV